MTDSPIRGGFKEMLSLLFKEDQMLQKTNNTTGTTGSLLAVSSLTGPCLEYFLENNVAEMLCSMGFANVRARFGLFCMVILAYHFTNYFAYNRLYETCYL